MQTTDARNLPLNTQENIRWLAVQAVLNGKTQVETAELVGVSRVEIWKWLKAYQQDGEQALQAKPQGRPAGGGKLKGYQAAWTARLVRGKYPDQLRLPLALWTREAVGALIERKFGVSLALSTIGRYLRSSTTWVYLVAHLALCALLMKHENRHIPEADLDTIDVGVIA